MDEEEEMKKFEMEENDEKKKKKKNTLDKEALCERLKMTLGSLIFHKNTLKWAMSYFTSQYVPIRPCSILSQTLC